MRRHIAVSAALGSLLMSSTALSQTPPEASPDLDVTAKQLDQARGSDPAEPRRHGLRLLQSPSSRTCRWARTPLNQVLLRAPGVVRDSFGQIHVRGDHGNLQYRLDGVAPEGLSRFSQFLMTRSVSQMSLLTGACRAIRPAPPASPTS